MRTWIKFCGTTSLVDASASAEAGADALGFIFAESQRRVSVEQAKGIVSALTDDLERVGVFVDEQAERVLAIAGETGLTGVQLHGGESTDYVAWLKNQQPDLRVIKTVLMNGDFHLHLEKFVTAAIAPDAILLDSGPGSGRIFDWRGVRSFLTGTDMKFIVAGGLHPENVAQAMGIFHPWGVDVVSGIESAPGKKDAEKLKDFVAAVRNAERN
jgi:phosphoribosylanthranilate isomerase